MLVFVFLNVHIRGWHFTSSSRPIRGACSVFAEEGQRQLLGSVAGTAGKNQGVQTVTAAQGYVAQREAIRKASYIQKEWETALQ